MNGSFKETWWPTSICHNTKYHFDNRFSIFFDAPQPCIKFFYGEGRISVSIFGIEIY